MPVCETQGLTWAHVVIMDALQVIQSVITLTTGSSPSPSTTPITCCTCWLSRSSSSDLTNAKSNVWGTPGCCFLYVDKSLQWFHKISQITSACISQILDSDFTVCSINVNKDTSICTLYHSPLPINAAFSFNLKSINNRTKQLLSRVFSRSNMHDDIQVVWYLVCSVSSLVRPTSPSSSSSPSVSETQMNSCWMVDWLIKRRFSTLIRLSWQSVHEPVILGSLELDPCLRKRLTGSSHKPAVRNNWTRLSTISSINKHKHLYCLI